MLDKKRKYLAHVSRTPISNFHFHCRSLYGGHGKFCLSCFMFSVFSESQFWVSGREISHTERGRLEVLSSFASDSQQTLINAHTVPLMPCCRWITGFHEWKHLQLQGHHERKTIVFRHQLALLIGCKPTQVPDNMPSTCLIMAENSTLRRSVFTPEFTDQLNNTRNCNSNNDFGHWC